MDNINIKYGMINTIIIVGILHLFSILLYFYKFSILFAVGELKIRLIYLIIFVIVKYFGLLLLLLLFYKFLLFVSVAKFFKSIDLEV
jgi:hypothetical protein